MSCSDIVELFREDMYASIDVEYLPEDVKELFYRYVDALLDNVCEYVSNVLERIERSGEYVAQLSFAGMCERYLRNSIFNLCSGDVNCVDTALGLCSEIDASYTVLISRLLQRHGYTTRIVGHATLQVFK